MSINSSGPEGVRHLSACEIDSVYGADGGALLPIINISNVGNPVITVGSPVVVTNTGIQIATAILGGNNEQVQLVGNALLASAIIAAL